jgi:hypothetical protein
LIVVDWQSIDAFKIGIDYTYFMLPKSKIETIAREVASATLKSSASGTVISEPAIDSEGRDALRITIVIKSNAAKQMTGDALLNTLVQIQDRLRKAGEERFPIVQYATKQELQEVDDT